MRLRKSLIVCASVAGAFALAATYASFHWAAGTRELRARLDAGRTALRPPIVDFRELEALPGCVQRYFRNVLKDGQAMLAGVSVQHTGSMNMSEAAQHWKPFTSDQLVVTQRPGFDWNARVVMLPGVIVRVHDAYVSGEGILHAALFGLISVASLRGRAEVAEGELVRFFAEAAWYPTALLPSQGVRWEAVDERSARATLIEGALQQTLLFTFDEQGLIETVLAEARGKLVGGKMVSAPWRGRFWNYVERNGMRVPLDGEVAWLSADNETPYWRGHIVDIEYRFAR
jgi:hypothetical protein